MSDRLWAASTFPPLPWVSTPHERTSTLQPYCFSEDLTHFMLTYLFQFCPAGFKNKHGVLLQAVCQMMQLHAQAMQGAS